MRESGFYTVNGKRRHMTDFQARRFRDMGKEVKGPLEDKSYKGPLEDKDVSELRKMARDRGLEGLSSARRSVLLEALNG